MCVAEPAAASHGAYLAAWLPLTCTHGHCKHTSRTVSLAVHACWLKAASSLTKGPHGPAGCMKQPPTVRAGRGLCSRPCVWLWLTLLLSCLLLASTAQVSTPNAQHCGAAAEVAFMPWNQPWLQQRQLSVCTPCCTGCRQLLEESMARCWLIQRPRGGPCGAPGLYGPAAVH